MCQVQTGTWAHVSLHPQEALLQAVRNCKASAAVKPCRALCQVAEHHLASLVQLGMRQARYQGRQIAEVQLYLTATVAHLTRTWPSKPVTQP